MCTPSGRGWLAYRDGIADVSTGSWGIALDPECHDYNCGIKLNISTSPLQVPDGGASFVLLGIALTGLGLLGLRLQG